MTTKLPSQRHILCLLPTLSLSKTKNLLSYCSPLSTCFFQESNVPVLTASTWAGVNGSLSEIPAPPGSTDTWTLPSSLPVK